MAEIIFTNISGATAIEPTIGQTTVYYDNILGYLAQKDSDGIITPVGGARITSDLTDTIFSTLENDQVLTYSTSLHKWVNKSIDVISGSTANYYTEAAYVVGDEIVFDRNDTLSAYTCDLSSIMGVALWELGSGTQSIQQINTIEPNIASGQYAVAMGKKTKATGIVSHSEGLNTLASGVYSHAHGDTTVASGLWSNVSGAYSTASGETSFVHSYQSVAGAKQSAILGGTDNILTINASGSTITAANGLVGNDPWTLYCDNLNVTNGINVDSIDLTSIILTASGGTRYTLAIRDDGNLIITPI